MHSHNRRSAHPLPKPTPKVPPLEPMDFYTTFTSQLSVILEAYHVPTKQANVMLKVGNTTTLHLVRERDDKEKGRDMAKEREKEK